MRGDRTSPPGADAGAMFRMIRGYWLSQIVGTLARFGVPDRLADGPLPPDQLAAAIQCDPQATHRLLRAAASVGVLSESGDGRFGLAPLGELLRSDQPGSMRNSAIALTGPGHWLPWGRLADAVRRGERQTRATLGRELFEYYADPASEGGAFAGAMADLSGSIADDVARVLDTSGARHVVDVGGATGEILAALLERDPSLRGTLLELGHMVPHAETALSERGLSSRCRVVEGDFFEAVPEADIHILKHVIHDWDDEQGVRILANCARASQGTGRVVLIEWVLPEDGRPSHAPLADLNMLVVLPGRERTVAEHRNLLRAAGLRLTRAVEIGSLLRMIEASPG